jgi:hypothetical protein
MNMSAQTDIVDDLPRSAMLEDQLGLAGNRKWALLGDVWSVLNCAFGDGFIQFEGLVDELRGCDEHRFSVGPPRGRVNRACAERGITAEAARAKPCCLIALREQENASDGTPECDQSLD